MADIIAKIGKYFADQESQMRDMYAQAAVAAASASVPAKSAVKAPVQPSRDASGGGIFDDQVIERPPSLLRRRLLTNTTGSYGRVDEKAGRVGHAVSEKAKDARGGAGGHEKAPEMTSRNDGEASSDAGSHSVVSTASLSAASSPSRRGKAVKKKKKLKKKKSEKASDSEEQVRPKRQQQERKAEEGLARAQERARRIHMERTEQLRQQQQEKEANAARLQEEMRKIEEIRQKGKQFALRLRPQSAPSTPQSSTTTLALSRWKEAVEEADGKQMKEAKRSFLNELEKETRDQMKLELVVSERAHRKCAHEQQEWAMLQSQIKKTADRNDIRAERVRSLTAKKKELEHQIEQAQTEAMRSRQERHQLEEKSKKERLQKQREAEREIHARLRKEESQRLVGEERKQSDEAAEARAKAKLRVQSRASLLKRVLRGFDVRAERTKSTNQEEETNQSDRPTAKEHHEGPELAEFEEDGLFEEPASPLTATEVSTVSPTRRAAHTMARRPPSQDAHTTFQWCVPSLPLTQIHSILREELSTGHIDDSTV